MNSLWNETHRALERDGAAVVAVIVRHRGSTPRTSGAKMLVHLDGQVTGTIGGGLTEADVIRSAGMLFKQQHSVLKTYDLSSRSGSGDMDLICGGSMQVLLEYIKSDQTSLAMYKKLSETADSGGSGMLVGKLCSGLSGEVWVERALLLNSEAEAVSLNLPPELFTYWSGAAGYKSTTMLEVDGVQYIAESLIPPKTVYLIGGGHVAKEIAPLASSASFRTVVIDDRDGFANRERFPLADAVKVCGDCSRPLEGCRIDENSYIIIVTRGHGFDREALSQALDTPAAYIGMIGSRRKRDEVYQNLREEGVTSEQLDRVHCPIGLEIGAQTPFEIAVSVVAEIIKHRADGEKR